MSAGLRLREDPGEGVTESDPDKEEEGEDDLHFEILPIPDRGGGEWEEEEEDEEEVVVV